MKKRLASILLAAALMVAVAIGGTVSAFAGRFEDECNTVFVNALEEVAQAEGLDTDSFEITREPLYDIGLNQLGYFYGIDAGVSKGFALAINNNGIFDVTEIYLDAEDPYAGYDGQRVYVKLLMYLIYDGENFIETASGAKLDEELLETVKKDAFYCAAEDTSRLIKETVTFVERTINNHSLAGRYPDFYGTGTKNSCVPTAGGNIIFYYDRFFPNLIPNYEPGRVIGENYYYATISNEVQSVIETLYDYMGSDDEGTSIEKCMQGMTQYVSEKGYSISFESCMMLGRYLYYTGQRYLDNNNPLILFLDTFNVTTIQETENTDYLQIYNNIIPHAMVAFGYREYTYTFASGGTRTDRFLAVASGIAGHSSGYYNVLYYTTIDEIYGVVIS